MEVEGRADARPTEVINEVFDLFAALDATDEQLDFPILYGSAKNGWMGASPEGPDDQGMTPLFDLVVRPPRASDHAGAPAQRRDPAADAPKRRVGDVVPDE